MKYSTSNFFDYLYHKDGKLKDVDKKLESHCSNQELKEELQLKRSKLRSILKVDYLREMQLEVEQVLTYQGTIQMEDYFICNYDLEILPHLVAPVWALEPQSWNGKCVLYCHGHDNYGAKGSFHDYGQENPYHKWLPLKFVKQGYKVVIPEFIGFGDMKKEDHIQEAERGCYINTQLLLMYGLNIGGLRVFEAMTMLGIMKNQWKMEDVTVFGTSGGGLVTTMLSAIDHRMNRSVISNYGATFKSSIMAMHHCVDNYIPNILTIGECSDILALIAPVPFLLSNGIDDRIFPFDGVKESVEKVTNILNRLEQLECLYVEYFDGGHEISLEKLFFFMDMT